MTSRERRCKDDVRHSKAGYIVLEGPPQRLRNRSPYETMGEISYQLSINVTLKTLLQVPCSCLRFGYLQN